jgi:hypothetical protein
LLIIGLIALLVGVGIVLYQRGSSAVNTLNGQLAQLQSIDGSGETLYEWADEEAREIAAGLRGFTLPDDAEEVQLARQGQTRPTYWLRFSLPAARLDAFLASTCIPDLALNTPPDFRYGRDTDIIANLPWWEPEIVAQASGAICTDSTGVTFRVLVDTHVTPAILYMEISPGDSV